MILLNIRASTKPRPLPLYPHTITGQYFPYYHALTRSVIALQFHWPLLSDIRRCSLWKKDLQSTHAQVRPWSKNGSERII